MILTHTHPLPRNVHVLTMRRPRAWQACSTVMTVAAKTVDGSASGQRRPARADSGGQDDERRPPAW